MKNKVLSMLTLLLAGGALVLPACSNAYEPEKGDSSTSEPPVEKTDDDDLTNIKGKPFRTVRAAADDDELVLPNKVILHYHNDDNACNTRRFYTWVTGVDGTERKPNGEWSAVDMEITLDFAVIPEYADLPSLYFIIKVAGTWAGQSEDTVVDYALYQDVIKDNNGVLELWTIPGEGTSVEIYKTKAESELPKVKTAKFVDFKTIHCTSTIDAEGKKWVPTEYRLYAYDKNYLNMTEAAQAANKEYFQIKQGVPTGNEFDIVFNVQAKINVQYIVETKFPGFDRWQKCIVGAENLYTQTRFDQYYTYDGELGMFYTPSKTTFRIWSPISANVLLNIYETGIPKSYGGNDDKDIYKMSYRAGGIWETTIEGDMAGSYYTFTLTHSAGTVETVDPYVKACGVNGIRGYIYDKDGSDANPSGWDSVPTVWDEQPGYDIKTPQDLSIYEIHIRDLTMDESWVSNKGNTRGTYKAFIEKGTTLTKNNKTVTTGFDHINELGVNAVQILPVFDQDNDERPEKMKFNWGYNPLNYNCVEGGYSPESFKYDQDGKLVDYDPLERIRDFKNMVMAFANNDQHTRVIMDVVYNHVSSASQSSFNKMMPKYYFRYTPNWEYYDGSGCNNEFKTDAKMGSKFVVDSLHWWAEEYKIKGFRFDLMGLIDCWTLDDAKQDLYNNVDKDIVLYGEGWTSGGYHGRALLRDKDSGVEFEVLDYGGQSTYPKYSPDDGKDIYPYFSDTRFFDLIKGGASNQQTYANLYASSTSHGQVGGFNDDGRDETKGRNDDGYNNNPYPQFGYISKGDDVGGLSSTVVAMLKGANNRAPGANPEQTINYMSCHDNYTLWDQLRYTLGSGRQIPSHSMTYAPTVKETIEASLACHGAVMMSNGVAFMQGGEELYRTKTYSYDLDDYNNVQSVPKADGSPATVRPYPEYKHYDSDPNVVCATQEVNMYGDIISHNSYKAPDYVNSFKWDRKIEVDNVDVSGYNEVWSKMVKARREMKRVSYQTMWVDGDTSEYNAWGDGYGSSVVAGWCRISSTQGYGFLFAGRKGGTFNWGNINIADTVFSNMNISRSGDNIAMPKYGFICYKLNG
jgi:pullulanase/glycogen debranching enzyme